MKLLMTDVDVLELVLEQARTRPPSELPALIGQLAQAQAVALARLQTPAPAPKEIDKLVGVEEASAMLGKSVCWVYRHHHELSCCIRRIGVQHPWT